MDEARAKDLLTEAINIGTGRAAYTLSELVKMPVIITIPDILIMDSEDVGEYVRKGVAPFGVYISQSFEGNIKGRALLTYSMDSSVSLLQFLSGEKEQVKYLSESAKGILEEIGNQLIVSYVSTLSNLIEDKIIYQVPKTVEDLSDQYMDNVIKEIGMFEKAIVVKNDLNIRGKNIYGYIILLLGIKSFDFIIERLEAKLA